MREAKALPARLKIVAQAGLGWAWLVSFSATALCSLPGFEFANPRHVWPVAGPAILLTLSGLGPAGLAVQTRAAWLRHALRLLVRWSRRLALLCAVLLGLLVLLTVVTFGYALGLWEPLYKLGPTRQGDSQAELVFFRRGDASIQLRRKSSTAYKPMVIRPLVPGINSRADLPPGQPDSSWVACYPPPRVPDQVQFSLMYWQRLLLEQTADPQQVAAAKQLEQRYWQAMSLVRGLNTLRFLLRADRLVPSGRRQTSQMRRLPTDGKASGQSYGAELTPEYQFVLRVLVTNDTAIETFYLAIPNFRGLGSYWLGDTQRRNFSARPHSGYVVLDRYDNGRLAFYTSTPATPCQLTITRYDTARHLVSGRFTGTLRTAEGRQAVLTDGFFDADFKSFAVSHKLLRPAASIK